MIKKVTVLASLSTLAFSSLLISCAKQTSAPGNSDDLKPVTLKVYQTVAALSDAEFQDYFVDPVKKKYPNITLELVRDNGKDTNMDNLIAANNVPDIIFTASNFLFNVITKNVVYDLNDFVKKSNMDLSRFDPTAISDIKAFSNKGELLAIPFSVNSSVLVYNKEIFNKFGVPFPKDNMTWEETIGLAKQVSKTVDGTNYNGIDVNGVRKFATALSLPLVDPASQKAVLANDGWKKAFQTAKAITDVLVDKKIGSSTLGRFFDQSLAMFTYYVDVFGDIEKRTKDGSMSFDWDIVSMPSFPEAQGYGLRSLSHDLSITSTTPHKEEAFKVIQFLTGDEVQTALTKRGIRLPALKDQKIRDSFGADNPVLKGKNIPAVFLTKPAKNPQPTIYDSYAESEIGKAFDKVLQGTDINTALREAEDAANQRITTEKAKN
ncbi:extracellular solute-binding protein [Paenibacillus filicis]|uniref:Extracellular solute-binding protein n=1 Tax=Paenibacillus gyeongsangnamensis TaxID=3388067 RepID=A0ABT4QEB5_9BACL|nr:extracellular solute-binding protein [Paenibacillus filicis]MCZ8515214.1 extracellular solute-binding protein [Paenibacillus filicis]